MKASILGSLWPQRLKSHRRLNEPEARAVAHGTPSEGVVHQPPRKP